MIFDDCLILMVRKCFCTECEAKREMQTKTKLGA